MTYTQPTVEQLRTMELHTYINISEYTLIMRVVDGWIYYDTTPSGVESDNDTVTATFVPDKID